MKIFKQDYSKYTMEDRYVWKLLFSRQMDILKETASKNYLDALNVIDFNCDKIPNFYDVNKVLQNLTGWNLEVVPGIVPKKDFFELLANQKFPATSWLRTFKQLDYLEEPDMFHDVFAHVPFLTNELYIQFFKKLSQIALKHFDNESAIELLGRIYWFTIEFGLISEAGKTKIYGAGILSSQSESLYCISAAPKHYKFDIVQIMDSPYRTDIMQEKYFIIHSFEQLYHSLPEIERLIEEKVGQKVG